MVNLGDYLIVSAVLFALSVAGMIINRKNVILLLMCVELLLLAVNTNFVAFAYFLNRMVGEVFVFFILTVAAAEIAIGLALVVLFYRTCGDINVSKISELRG